MISCVFVSSTICSQILQDPTATSGQYLCWLGHTSRAKWYHHRVLPQVPDRYSCTLSNTLSMRIKSNHGHFRNPLPSMSIITLLNTRSKTTIPLKYLLKSVINTCLATLWAGKHSITHSTSIKSSRALTFLFSPQWMPPGERRWELRSSRLM